MESWISEGVTKRQVERAETDFPHEIDGLTYLLTLGVRVLRLTPLATLQQDILRRLDLKASLHR
jgi:hypothetical protein